MYQVFNDLFINIYMMTFIVAVPCDLDPFLQEKMASKSWAEEDKRSQMVSWKGQEDDLTKTEILHWTA